VLGYTPEEWLADPDNWYRALHPDDREYALAFEDRRLIGLDMHPPAEYRLKARDGHYVWMYERARLLPDRDDNPVWHGVMQDISALKSAEGELARKAEQQVLVARLGEMAVRGEDPDELMRAASDWIGKLDHVLEASIWEQENYERLHIRHRSADIGRQTVIPFLTSTFPGAPLIRGESVLIPNWNQQDPRLDPYRDVLPEGVVSSAITPILGADQQFGLIIVHSDRAGAFTEEDGNFLLATANVLGNAIERTRSDQSLHHRLNHDLLTELPNRRLFTHRLAKALETAHRERSTVGLLFLDLDHFKLINDGIGHHAGDEILREVAPRLSRSVRPGDTVSRFGGDEFGIVLASLDSEAEAREIAARVLDGISRPMAVQGTERLITASIGIALWSPDSEVSKGPEDLIQEADAAMYQAKESGRSRIQTFGSSIQEKMLRRLEVERQLHGAIERDDLAVAYQPIVSLDTGNLAGFEALVRWEHPEDGLLLPEDFIPIAEESELIRKLDTWVLRRAVAQATEWNRDRDRPVAISVNCSARQIRGQGFTELVSQLLEQHDLPPELLTVELTETVLLAGSEQVSSVLEGLARLGVRLALDDFGTGFSSLSYLGEFPLDEIKIDRKFIDYLAEGDPRGSAIADAIVQIGKALSMVVVAEAVSTESTLQMVRDLGCHAAQGYLIAKPLSVEDATRLVARPDPLYPG
ncbi:MAG: EAL domain-containing protein, partial [Actinomycetota bacterium]|nr:EAL domain-containing protein [Actinomycetota bacterium]